MAFASVWLNKKALFPELIIEAPAGETGIIVVIPAFNEPGIAETLNSLKACNEPDCRTEILIIINSPLQLNRDQDADRETLTAIEKWKDNNYDYFFRLYTVCVDTAPYPGWGAGLARKTGMDEAVRRFNKTGRSDGVIASLDADCLVEKSYLTALCNDLFKKKERSGCSISFEHQLTGSKYPQTILKAASLYELHMRYFYQGLKYSGFPHVYHTIGSAFAVKALPYVRSGGMNRRQAGEDFWFIQKLIPSGGWFSLNTTKVYPSPRPSDRVPFGTGPVVARIVRENQKDLLTYNFRGFRELRSLFGVIDSAYHHGTEENSFIYGDIPNGVKSFIVEKEWTERIKEIKTNTSGLESFKKRFFNWFNMFRTVKYLNFVHKNNLSRVPVTESVGELLHSLGLRSVPDDPAALLMICRSLENEVQ
jgi:glycosyltransferase involved in cell wall biosynthesis